MTSMMDHLYYRGQSIHRQSETSLICLSDLWNVQGGDIGKSPLDWIRLETTQKLLKNLIEPNETVLVLFQSENNEPPDEQLVAEISGILETTGEGQELCTYATEELAAVYARFLSLECYKWAMEHLVEGKEEETDYSEYVEARTKARRQKEFSRRALIAAGWAAPVVLSAGLNQKAVAAGSDHVDFHVDFNRPG